LRYAAAIRMPACSQLLAKSLTVPLHVEAKAADNWDAAH
jgi:hypothetical protein